MNRFKSTPKFSFNLNPYHALALGILFVSLLRGIRFPNLWSYTHFLFNYNFGFVKRGLLGEIVSRLDNPYFISYNFFLLFSLTIFIINIILLYLLITDFIKNNKHILFGSALVYVSGLGIVFLAHTIGYSDQIGLLITLITLKIQGFYKKLLFIFPATIFALLTHEAFLILFFPTIFISLLLSIEKREKNKFVLFALFSVFSLSLAFLASHFTLSPQKTQAIYNSLASQTDIPLRKDAFNVLYQDARSNYQHMQYVWTARERLVQLVQSLMVTLPSLALFIYITYHILKQAQAKSHIIILAILASISPLLLHFFAWDMHRWNTLAITSSFLVLYATYASKRNPPISLRFSKNIYAIFVFLLFLNGISQIDLFDRYYVKLFPFFEHQQYIASLLFGRDVFPHIPLY